MNVNELINALNKIEDKSLPIKIVKLDEFGWHQEEYWLEQMELSNKASTLGYEIEEEVKLIGGEQ